MKSLVSFGKVSYPSFHSWLPVASCYYCPDFLRDRRKKGVDLQKVLWTLLGAAVHLCLPLPATALIIFKGFKVLLMPAIYSKPIKHDVMILRWHHKAMEPIRFGVCASISEDNPSSPSLRKRACVGPLLKQLNGCSLPLQSSKRGGVGLLHKHFDIFPKSLKLSFGQWIIADIIDPGLRSRKSGAWNQ